MLEEQGVNEKKLQVIEHGQVMIEVEQGVWEFYDMVKHLKGDITLSDNVILARFDVFDYLDNPLQYEGTVTIRIIEHVSGEIVYDGELNISNGKSDEFVFNINQNGTYIFHAKIDEGRGLSELFEDVVFAE